MKKILYIWTLLLTCWVAVSCSSDDDEQSVSPVFPERVTFNVQPEEWCELSFDANMNWQLTTDKQWVKFADEDGNRIQHLQGKAGEKQTVKITVTNGAQGFVDDKAVVRLRQGDEEQVIAEIIRPAKERVAKMYRADNSEMIEISRLEDNQFDAQKPELIGFAANFDWKVDVASLPAWIVEDENSAFLIRNLSGEAGQAVSFNRMAKIDVGLKERYQDRNGFITIRDINSDYTCQFPIYAPAIEAGKIQWIGQTTDLKSGFLWDDKGNQLKKQLPNNDIIWLDEPVVCRVLIRDNQFTPRFVEWNTTTQTATEISSEESWVTIAKQEGGVLTLQAKKNTQRDNYRKLTLFLLPEGVEITDFTPLFTEFNGYIFTQNGYGINLEQYGLLGGFGIGERVQEGYRYLFKQITEATEVADPKEIVEKLHLVQPANIYEYSISAEEWNSAKELGIAPLSLIEKWGSEYKLYNSKFEYVGQKPTGWSNATMWSRMGAYNENNVYTYFLNLTQRLPYERITDDCLYVVFCKGDKDLGTIVIRKK